MMDIKGFFEYFAGSGFQLTLTVLVVVVLLVFISGALIGLVSFANVLSWLFKHYEMITLSALTIITKSPQSI